MRKHKDLLEESWTITQAKEMRHGLALGLWKDEEDYEEERFFEIFTFPYGVTTRMEQHIGFTKTELESLRDKIDEALDEINEETITMKCPGCKERRELPKNYVESGQPTCGRCRDDYQEGPVLVEVEEQ